MISLHYLFLHVLSSIKTNIWMINYLLAGRIPTVGPQQLNRKERRASTMASTARGDVLKDGKWEGSPWPKAKTCLSSSGLRFSISLLSTPLTVIPEAVVMLSFPLNLHFCTSFSISPPPPTTGMFVEDWEMREERDGEMRLSDGNYGRRGQASKVGVKSVEWSSTHVVTT